MRKQAVFTVAVAILLFVSICDANAAQSNAAPHAVIFFEASFPSVDSPEPVKATLSSAIADAVFSDAQTLPTSLLDANVNLLVLPYGSAFPETAWPAIQTYLSRGGNLLVIGGRPFLRAAYLQQGHWVLRDESVRFSRQLLINDYSETPGSDSLRTVANEDIPLGLAAFRWKRAFSPIIRLSTVDIYPRQGSAGSLDARLDALVWGDRDGTHLAAPVIQIDHLQHQFGSGRWMFVQCELDQGFYSSSETSALISKLARQAARGSEDLMLRPRVPLFLQNEGLEFHLTVDAASPIDKVKITVVPEENPKAQSGTEITGPHTGEVNLPAVTTKGFHHVRAEFYQGDHIVRVYHSGFWIRDEEYLRSGPRLGVNADYFELDGKPLPVVGTTYMSSEVQRLFFSEPNAYVWDRDMAQISGNGLNMIRTGWWTDWPQVVDQSAEATDTTLRTLEAFLMTARRHNLPVQFTFFAFLPDVLGGTNSYLDPAATERQQRLVLSVVNRFKDVPFLAYDLINEPSFSQYTWRTRPNGDPLELAAWNDWLKQKYPDRQALLAAWDLPASQGDSPLSLPTEQEFDVRGEYTGHNGLKLYDFYIFAQDTFADWVSNLQHSIRSTGSKQLITVGQDDGGISERPNPAFFGRHLDFTTNHTWWLNNELLWCSLAAKQQGRPMLIQETGLQRELTLEERTRRTDENEAALFERKLAMSFAQGTGALEWLWNLNTFMSEDNEVPIGSVRADGTMKAEGRVLGDFARFITSMREQFSQPQKPEIAIITSQASQYSVLNRYANLAQQRAVRALAYGSHLPAYVVTENQLASSGKPKLAILPSPQALTAAGWQHLIDYVKSGGDLLITGPVARDEHWHRTDYMKSLGVNAEVLPLTFSEQTMDMGDSRPEFHYDLQAQNLLEWIRFSDGQTFHDVSAGTGHIFWASSPVELSEDLDSIATLYTAAAAKAKVKNLFTVKSAVPSGILIYPQEFADHTLYIFSSETGAAQSISIRDAASGKDINFQLAPQRAALIFVRKSDGKILGSYGAQH